jgi:alkylation response protein AidB-like acyl-CoA dehydrogenase
VTLNNSGGTPLDTAVTTEGLAKRTACFTSLTASTTYGIAIACDGNLADVANTSFTTKAAPAGGNRTVPIQLGDATTYPTAARATVEYDDNAALSTPATQQNTDCAAACTVSLTIPAGLWYYRVIRQTAADATLHTGPVQPLQVQ